MPAYTGTLALLFSSERGMISYMTWKGKTVCMEEPVSSRRCALLTHGQM